MSIPGRSRRASEGREWNSLGYASIERGDPPAWINWNASARHPEGLYSNEFEQERVADVGIVLDGRLRTNVVQKDHSLFEYSIQAVAALADTFLAQGNRVGLLHYGHYLHWTFPGYGKIQRERILHDLAQAEPGESLVFSDLGHIPAQLFPAHSQIVLVSPLIPGDYDVLVQLRARGYQVMVVSPDPVAFELAYLPKDPQVALAGRMIHLERALLLQRLSHAGVQVLELGCGKTLRPGRCGSARTTSGVVQGHWEIIFGIGSRNHLCSDRHAPADRGLYPIPSIPCCSRMFRGRGVLDLFGTARLALGGSGWSFCFCNRGRGRLVDRAAAGPDGFERFGKPDGLGPGRLFPPITKTLLLKMTCEVWKRTILYSWPAWESPAWY